MSLRKLILLCLGVAVVLSGATFVILHIWKPGTSAPATATGGEPSTAYAYLTEQKLIVMRSDRVVAEVPRLSDGADPSDNKVVWTHSGTYVAMLSDAQVRQDDLADLELIVVNARTGAVQRTPCANCGNITPIADNSILALASDANDDEYHFLRFDLGASTSSSPSDLPLPPNGSGAPSLLISGRSRVIVNHYVDGGEELSLTAVDGSFNRVLGTFTSNDYMPSAVSGGGDDNKTVFAVAFRTVPGSCGPFPIYLFDSRGVQTRTDMSNAAPDGTVMYKHGLLVNDLWWGPDGHFHAAIDSVSCVNREENDATSTTKASAVWRLDGTVWFQERSGSILAARQLDAGTDVALVPHHCKPDVAGQERDLSCLNTGTLYQEKAGRRTPITDNVIGISAPSPATVSVPAATLPAAGVAADKKFTPYVGTWTKHGYTLRIRADHTGELVGINAQDAADGPGEPGPPDYRERATLTFLVQPTGVTAHVLSASTPNPPGSGYGAPWYTAGQDIRMGLDIENGLLDFGTGQFCATSGKAATSGLCGD